MTTIQSSGIEPGQRRLNGPQTIGRNYRNLSRPAKLKGASGQANAAAPKQRRPMSAATRKKVAAAQRARWAK
jgi:hypothetical protein